MSAAKPIRKRVPVGASLSLVWDDPNEPALEGTVVETRGWGELLLLERLDVLGRAEVAVILKQPSGRWWLVQDFKLREDA
jgi:hypothetical protein